MTQNKEWCFCWCSLDELIPNSKNPRKVSKKALDKLVKQIKEVGFHSPIKVDNNGVILGGNTRYKALQILKDSYPDLKVPVMKPNFQLSDREREEIIITDNVNDGDWDIPTLIDDFLMEDLEEWGLDDLNVSFDDPDLDVEEPEPTKKEQKMYCCPNCGHINVKKAFEQNDGKGY